MWKKKVTLLLSSESSSLLISDDLLSHTHLLSHLLSHTHTHFLCLSVCLPGLSFHSRHIWVLDVFLYPMRKAFLFRYLETVHKDDDLERIFSFTFDRIQDMIPFFVEEIQPILDQVSVGRHSSISLLPFDIHHLPLRVSISRSMSFHRFSI